MLRICAETRILLMGFFRATDIMIHVPSLLLARHSPVAALAEKSDPCKAEPQGSTALSADAKGVECAATITNKRDTKPNRSSSIFNV